MAFLAHPKVSKTFYNSPKHVLLPVTAISCNLGPISDLVWASLSGNEHMTKNNLRRKVFILVYSSSSYSITEGQ